MGPLAAFVGAPADSEDFNCFDAALCDAATAAFLVDLWVAARCVVAGFCVAVVRVLVLALVAVFVEFTLPEAVLDDFFCVSLDIRLPFDAFSGSTRAVLQLSSGLPESGPRLGKSDDAGVWLQGIPSTTPLLVERALGAK
jgi:hypothetical protein